MIPRSIAIPLLFALAAGLSIPAQAQSVLFRIRTGSLTQLVQQGGTVTVAAPAVNGALDLQIGVLYQGVGTASLTRYELAGSPDLRVVSAPNVPITLRTDDEARWNCRFQPRSSSHAEAQFAVTVRESLPDGTLLSQTISVISLVGTAPEIVVAQTTADGSVLRVNTGDVLTFPLTPTGSTATLPMAVFNRGSGAGRLESVSVDSPDFQVIQLPILPDAIDSFGEMRFAVRYSPRSAGSHSGVLRIRSADAEVVASLSGRSSDPQPNTAVLGYYRYDGAAKIRIEPGDTIPFPDVPFGQRSVVKFRIENLGSTESSALFVSADGGGFSLAEGSIQIIIEPNSGIDLTLVFQADQAGTFDGRLFVAGLTFGLRGTALGPALKYRYDSGAGSYAVTQGGRIYVAASPLGMSQKTIFTIENAGNQPASIAGIQLVNGQASLRLEGIPDAPFMLGSGETTTFGINFTPTAVGTFTDVLLIGQSSFDVSGAGLKPPSLPDYELKSSISSITPAQQGSISLRLAEPYPLKLSGTIRLRISPNSVGVDPAAQFAVSGRTVNFRIAPNSTEAVFDDGSQAAQFQVGTVTSTLIFVPSFATVGEVDVTPDNPATLSLFLPPSPPSLLNARITDVTSTGFAVSVNGISSNKSLLSIDMTLVSADGGVARRSVDLKSFSQVWFGTALSDPYGGLFSVTVPFRVPVGGSRVQSITLTVRNELGDSNSLTVQNP